MKVLIVDDEKGVLKMYSGILRENQFEVVEAPDGATGLRVAKDQKPDIILLDILMPLYNGLDVLKDMRNDEFLKNTPIYLLTNLPQENMGDKAKDLGANGYLVKAECEPKTVLDLVKKNADKPKDVPTNPQANPQA